MQQVPVNKTIGSFVKDCRRTLMKGFMFMQNRWLGRESESATRLYSPKAPSYINYKNFHLDKISDKYFGENLLDETSNKKRFCHSEIFF